MTAPPRPRRAVVEARASSTRSIRGRSPTPTATASATSAGIIEHLDHLDWLGVDGIWLSPVTVSPNADWGYDVSDFCAIAPELGTLDDFDRLVAEAADRGIRVLMDIVPNHTSEQHPWFVGLPLVTHGGAPGLVRLGRRQGRGGTTEQLGQQLRRPGLDARRDDRPVLLPQPPGVTARPQLVERRGARHLRRHLPLLVRPGRGRVPHRRLQRHHQGRPAPRQPAGHRGRRLRHADARAAQRVQRQPARGARGPPALAAPGRQLRRAPSADRRDPRPDGQAGRVLRRRPGRARAGLQLQLHQRALLRRRDAGRRRGDGGRVCRPGRGRRGRAPTTTCSASPPAGPPTIRAGCAWPSSCCSACAAPRSSTRATRSAWRTSAVAREDLRDPLGVRFCPVLRGARRRPDADAVARRPRGRVHRRRPAVAPTRRHRRGQRGAAAGRPGLGPRPVPGPHRVPPRALRVRRRRLRVGAGARRGVGLGARGSPRGRPEHVRCARPARTAGRDRFGSAPTGAASSKPVRAGALELAPFEGLILERS